MARSLAPLRVAPGGAYFEDTNHEPFLFIGPNDAITWPGLCGVYRRKDLDGARSYVENMAQNGVTVLRIMLEYAHRDHRYFEYPHAGRFNPAMVKMWDDLFSLCDEAGVRILLAPWDNFWMSRRWKRHPYNQVNGGPLHSCGDFFTTEAAFSATLNRFTFVIERWGGSGVLGAWDLFNEIHPYWGGSPQEQSDFIARLSDAIRDIELKTWGVTRPQTVSIFGPRPDGGYSRLVWAHPCLDFASTHIYEQGAIDYPTDPVHPALVMQKWARFARREIARENGGKMRPFTDSEHGPIHLFNDHRKYLPEERDDWYERHLMWAHLASGGAGSGMRWPARDPHVLTTGMKSALRSLRDFSRLAEWRGFAPRVDSEEDAGDGMRLETGETGENHAHLFACRDDTQIIAWVLQRSGQEGWASVSSAAAARPCSLRVAGVVPQSRWRVVFWDTVRGVRLNESDVSANAEGELVVAFPAALWQNREDVALLLRRI